MTLNTARVTFEEQELLFKKSDYIANPMREESPVVTGSFLLALVLIFLAKSSEIKFSAMKSPRLSANISTMLIIKLENTTYFKKQTKLLK